MLQTIQYRSTGVILKVKPIIFAGRVELEVQQEVSSAGSTSTGVNVSPTFSTRKVETKVSIRDGATVALGGLISRTENKGNVGIPFLKDIPFAGQLFRTNTQDADETELIILITPYVVENDLVAEQVTQALRGQMGTWAQTTDGPPPAVKIAPPLSSTVINPPQPRSAQPATSELQEPVPTPPSPAASAPGETLAQPMVKPPAGVSGVPVTDPALLEELRKAGVASSSAKPGAKDSKTDAGKAPRKE